MGKLAVIFPGQGAQYSGMGASLFQEYPSVQSVFSLANEALGYDLQRIMFCGSEEELKLTERTQPAILTHSMAAWEILKGMIRPGAVQAMAGLSLGEFSALTAAGVLRLREAVTSVRERGAAMQNAVPVGVGAMAAILGLAEEPLQDVVARTAAEYGTLEVANYNAPGQIVISGKKEAVEAAVAALKAAGIARAVMLPVSAPFHCSLLQSAADRLAEVLREVQVGEFSCPVIANVSAQSYPNSASVKELLIRQVTHPVRWEQSMRLMLNEGFDTFIELGPGTTLCQFMKRIAKDAGFTVTLASLDKADDVPKLREVLDSLQLLK